MNDVVSVVSYGLGTVLGFLMIGGLIFLIIHDVTQKKHTVLRYYPGRIQPRSATRLNDCINT